MDNILLPSLEIHGFRGFDHLKINRLGKINLIVGKNNVGKSSLLEALWIYSNRGSPYILRTLLEGRDEFIQEDSKYIKEDTENQFLSISYLFHGRKPINNIQDPIEIGPIDEPQKRLQMNFVWYNEIIDNEKGVRRLFELENLDSTDNPIPGILIKYGKNSIQNYRLDRSFYRRYREQIDTTSEKKCVYVPANGLSPSEIEKYWDSITLTSAENDVLRSLQIIESSVEKVNLIGGSQSYSSKGRIPIIKISGLNYPIPLRNLGEGMNRVMGIALSLVNAKGGILLIDEFESGLHYSVQCDIWKLVFNIAIQLNIEVFATTHSWDCIEAFQKSSQESDIDGCLIRLENKRGKILPTIFDEKKLSIATHELIEIR